MRNWTFPNCHPDHQSTPFPETLAINPKVVRLVTFLCLLARRLFQTSSCRIADGVRSKDLDTIMVASLNAEPWSTRFAMMSSMPELLLR